MNKAVIIFSIDDGRYDLYQLAKEVLMPQNVPATLNITTNSGYSKVIPSLPREELLETLKELADTAVENKYCLIYLLHSVFKADDKNYSETWSYDFDKFKELVDYIKELQTDGKADIMTTMQYVDMRCDVLR